MELIIFLIIAWLVAPIVLGIICICQHVELKKLRAENSRLNGNAPAADVQRSAPVAAPPVREYYPAPQPDTSKNTDIPVRPAEPRVSPASDAPGKKGTSTINIILILGAMFISLAGFVFAAAAWGVLNTFFKSVMLLSFSAVFFAIHSLAKRKLKLDMTGRVFYTLGSVFLPAAVAAAGLLKVFGEYFSFGGEGRLLMISLMAALLSGCFFKGAADYKSRNYARIAYASFTCAAAALIIHAADNTSAAALALSVYALVMLAIEPMACKVLGENVISSEYHYFTLGNIWILAIISLFLSDGETLFVIPTVIFSASFFLSALKGKDPMAGTCACAAYLLAGAYLGIRPESFDGFVLIAALVMIVYTCLSMMDIIPEKMREITGKIQSIAAAAVLAVGFIGSLGDEFHLTVLIASAAVFAQLIVMSMRSGSGYIRSVCFGSFIWLAFEGAKRLSDIPELHRYAPVIFAAVIFLYFAAVKLTPIRKRLYVKTADILVCAALLICLFAYNIGPLGVEGGVIIWLFCASAAFISGHDFVFGRAFAPIAVFSAAYPLYHILRMIVRTGGEYHTRDLWIYTVCIFGIIYCIISAFMLIKPFKKYAHSFSFGIPVILIAYLFIMEDGSFLSVPAAMTAYCALNLISNRNSSRFIHYSNAFFTMLCFAALELGRLCIDGEEAAVFPAAAMLILFGAYIMPLSDKNSRISECLGRFLLWAVPVYGVITATLAEDFSSAALLVSAWALALCGCAVSCMRKKVWLMYIFLPVMYISTYIFGEREFDSAVLYVTAAVMAVFCAAGRLVFRRKAFSREEPASSDFMTVTALTGAAMFLADGGDTPVWIGFLTSGLIILNLVRKDHSPRLNRALMTVSSVILLPVWWTQPFFTLPEIIETEWNLLPVAAVCVLIKLIHRENTAAADNISFAAAIISLIVLFIDAVGTGYPADAVILGAVIVSILAASFILRRKRWFVLSAAAAVSEALLLTMRLWNSRTWWIYLLIAGVILIVLGMANEINKQKRRNGEETKLKRFMSDWKW